MQYGANGALLGTEIPGIKLVNRGKVRDVYDLGDALLFVATDRLSAFDVVMTTGIPRKGEVLTQISLFWFDLLKDVPNHLISADVTTRPELVSAAYAVTGARALRQSARLGTIIHLLGGILGLVIMLALAYLGDNYQSQFNSLILLKKSILTIFCRFAV